MGSYRQKKVSVALEDPNRSENAPQNHEDRLKSESKYLFKWIAQTGMFVYMESGAIPGMLIRLKNRFGMDYFQLGLLGSVVYLSLSIGCPVFGWLFRHYNAKQVLGVALALNNITTLFFAMCPTGLPNLFIFLRAVIGFFQAALVVYTPVWIDEFAPKGSHATWMAWLQAATPFGIMFGYMAATAFTLSDHDSIGGIYTFRYPFLIQVIVVTPYCIGVWTVPSRHINVNEKFRKKRPHTVSLWESDLKVSRTGEGTPRSTNHLGDIARKAMNYTSGSGVRLSSTFLVPSDDAKHEHPSQQQLPSTDFATDAGERAPQLVLTDSSNVSDEKGANDEEVDAPALTGGIQTKAAHGTGTPISGWRGGFVVTPEFMESGGGTRTTRRNSIIAMVSYLNAVWMLVTNATYMSIVFSLSALYFVVTGIQYWATDYLESELNGNEKVVRGQFLLTSATAPVAGVIFGGWFVEYIGGYKSTAQRRKAIGWCLVFGILASVAAVFVTAVYNTWEATALLWVLLFFGGAVLPGGSGIFISVIPTNIRTVGSSFAAILFNLFGYFLSPFLSGLISEEYGSLTLGFRIILGWSGFAIIFFAIAYYTSPKPDSANETLLGEGRIGSRSRSTSQEHDHKSRQIVGNPLDVDSIGSDLGNIEEHSGFEDGAGMIEPKSTSEAEVRVL